MQEITVIGKRDIFNLVHLRSFVSIAQLGSFTIASQKLGLREPLVWLAAAPEAVLTKPILPLIVFPGRA
ncbi:hypothetical protein SAMN05880582_11347 [Rhizobium sp. RU20A]|nr:hypothetical protein SAMN05880582_11347 [Rhizobium sp. RU20A]